MKSRWLVSAALAVSVNGVMAHALGADAPNDSLAVCAGAYERSQEHRQVGELLTARSELATCAQPECPEFIRSDCTRWSKEIAAAQPSVVFSAKRGAERLTQVRVSSGDKILAERLEGQVIDLDPGAYDFRFETQGSSPIVRHALLSAGDSSHLVQVEFAEPTVKPADPFPVSVPRAGGSEQTPQGLAPGPRALPWTLVAVGAASIGTGVGLSLWGRSAELRLRGNCAPDCSNASVQQVRTKYLFADLSFGVGLTSLAAAVYLFARDGASGPTATRTLPITVVAGTTGVVAAYGSRF